ncbi:MULTISPECIES: hypothetical protein [Azorhizobium]|uniref:hypothetical protein n=1 Tax=Azorhizobium TaxID=6 RepID=UPI001060F7BD|nr:MULTISPECIES: hypothetical protein [Azorhizobium]TDT92690.1 hypothetical protein DFO45_3451 [Azorhizobium sp. AG788]
MMAMFQASQTLMEAEHQFDDRTAYCTRCGCHWNTAYQLRRGCITAENVSAISHLRARARLDALLTARRMPRPPKGA